MGGGGVEGNIKQRKEEEKKKPSSFDRPHPQSALGRHLWRASNSFHQPTHLLSLPSSLYIRLYFYISNIVLLLFFGINAFYSFEKCTTCTVLSVERKGIDT